MCTTWVYACGTYTQWRLCRYLRLEMTDWRAQTKRGLIIVGGRRRVVCLRMRRRGGGETRAQALLHRSYLFTDIPPGTKQQRGAKNYVPIPLPSPFSGQAESSEVTRALPRVFFAAISDRAFGEERHAFSRRGNKNRATFPGSPFAHSGRTPDAN